MPEEDLLNVQELATLLRRPKSTIYLWNRKGTAPRRLRIGGQIMYRRADVNAWLNSLYVVEPDTIGKSA